MNKDVVSVVVMLTEYAREIIAGSFKHVDRIFHLTDQKIHSPEIANLAEAFGMMVVKVEARELALEQTIDELKWKKLELELSLKAREEFGRIFILFTLLIGLYSFVVAVISRPAFRQAYGTQTISWIGLLFVGCLIALAITLIRRSGLRLSSFGLNLRNAWQSIWESALVTLVILAGCVLFKMWARNNLPDYQGAPILNWKACNIFFWTYFIAAPAQEFIARGVFQGSVERTMSGRFRSIWAIVTTSVLFGVFHTFYSVPLALISILASLIWGWLYARHGTLIGVSISHFLIGNALVLLEFGFIVPSCT